MWSQNLFLMAGVYFMCNKLTRAACEKQFGDRWLQACSPRPVWCSDLSDVSGLERPLRERKQACNSRAHQGKQLQIRLCEMMLDYSKENQKLLHQVFSFDIYLLLNARAGCGLFFSKDTA